MFNSIPYSGKCNVGFSIAEMSVVLVIIGFIASSAISVAISNDYTSKRDETESKLDRIEEALAGYVSSTHKLPCPADGTIAISNSLFGLEKNDGATPPVCSANFSSGNVRAGVVPTRTLGLPDDFMFDGWGRRIDYAVDYRFANSDVTNTGCASLPATSTLCFRDTSAGSITVNDAAASARTASAVYILISHGENGHGAYPKNGGSTRVNGFPPGSPYRNATASANEITNANLANDGTTVPGYGTTFVMRDYTRVDDGTTSDGTSATRIYFDDQVRFRDKAQIVKAAGAYIYDTICKTSLIIVNGVNPDGTANTDCNNATDSTQCLSFATDVNLRCLQ